MGGEGLERMAGLLPCVAINISHGEPFEQPVEFGEEVRVFVQYAPGGWGQPWHAGQRLLQEAPFLLLGEVPGEMLLQIREPAADIRNRLRWMGQASLKSPSRLHHEQIVEFTMLSEQVPHDHGV